MKFKFLTVFFTIILSIYLVELLIISKKIYFSFVNENISEKYDKYKIVNQSKNKKESIYPSFSLTNLFDFELNINGSEVVILSLVSNSKILHCKRFNEWLFFKSDRYGFRNKDTKWDGKIDTVILGDSFGISECVQENNSMSKIIETSNKVSGLLNLAQTGNGPLLQLAILMEYGKSFKPKNVIWFYFEGNDLLELRKEKSNINLLRYLYEDNYDQGLKKKQKYINAHFKKYVDKKLLEKKKEKIKKFNLKVYFEELIKLRNFRSLISLSKNNSTIENVDSIFFEIIDKANQEIKNWDGKLYFVYLPTRFRFEKPNIKDIYENSKKNIFNNLAKRDINLIDIHKEIFNSTSKAKNFYDLVNGHYTIDTYKMISEKIITNLD